DPTAWPSGAAPVSRTVTYDDEYRVKGVTYAYSGGAPDAQSDPYRPDIVRNPTAKPIFPTDVSTRVTSHTFEYDWLGNTSSSDDDLHHFFDRSLGAISNGSPDAGPH